MTLTLDFQGQVSKNLYLRNGRADWHGTKGMWVDRILDPHCDFELWHHPWPGRLIFKVKFWKRCDSGMGCPIDMERKGCESIGCWTHIVTLNCDRTHDLDPWVSRSNFEKVITQEWDARLTWNLSKGMWIDWMLDPRCDFQLWPHLWPWPWNFNFKFWNSCIPGMGGPLEMEQKGYESIRCYTYFMTLTLDFQGQTSEILYLRNGKANWHRTKAVWVDRMLDSHCDLELWPHPWPWPWNFKVNFWNSCISGTTGTINMEWKGYEWIGCYTN